jgi:hypothetical protein
MQPGGEKNIQVKRRMMVVLVLLPLFMGFAAFMNILGDPRFQAIRNLDVVRLIAVGACWGAAAAGLAMLIGSKFQRN